MDKVYVHTNMEEGMQDNLKIVNSMVNENYILERWHK
jgi:hypothetical protein